MTAGDAHFEVEEFARAFQRFLEWVPGAAVHGERFSARLARHFGTDARAFPATKLEVASYDRPNVQVALDAYLSPQHRSAELLGFATSHVDLSQLVAQDRVQGGPVGRTMVELDHGRSLACVTRGLFLIADGEDRLAVLVASERFPSEAAFVEVMAPELERAEAFLTELRQLMNEHNVYRQKVISLSGGSGPMGTTVEVTFHRRQHVARERIVLSKGLLERVEHSTLEFDRHAEALRRQGFHLRRGLLLHGPPGTGKTLVATYLAGAFEDRTVLVLTGPSLALIRPTCSMARALQPSMVVLEDIDLVAQERTMREQGARGVLFQLLNEIDGMGTDADVVFVMTTNRADLIEPALAARPGRVDQAVEFPLPDAASRKRLLEVYCEGLHVDLADADALIERTEGASPAFLRELVRKAFLLAAMGGEPAPGDAHFAEALRDLEEGGRLTRNILGAGDDGAPVSPAATGFPQPGDTG